jgi:type IV pilus assembly protein PilW
MTGPLPHPAQRGYSLIELAVSLVVAAILAAGAFALLTQQQRALQNTSADRAMQETVRSALGELGVSLRRAGFAVEPPRAFDFDTYQCAGGAVLCRDRVDASDEIVFYARDPGFKAQLASAPSASQLVITGGLQSPLHRGQILQVMCASASDSTYVTVSQKVAANWVPPAAPPVTTAIPLAADTGSFPNQGSRLDTAGSCFQTASANVRVYRVDRFRYFVASFADPETAAGRPYLMLDRGLLDDDGTPRVEPVAPDVEDVQFEYVFVTPATNVPRTVGAVSGTRLANAPASVDLAAAAPAYDARNNDPTRATNHPANIRAVRVHVVVRSPGTDITKRTNLVQANYAEGGLLPAAANRPVIAGETGHVRVRVETTEATRNLESRGPYYDP